MASPESVDTLVEAHQGELLRFATSLLNDAHLAQDAVQQAFIKLVSRRAVDNPRAWLYRVVRNDCLNQLRKNRRMTVVETMPENPDACVADAGAELAAADDRALVLQALDRLRDSWKEVVLLKFRERLSYREIAEVTGHSVSHVGVILYQALAEMRRECRREWEGIE